MMTMAGLRRWALALVFALAACATAPAPVAGVTAAAPGAVLPPAGVRLGLMVATLDGETVRASRAGERFLPASNTKIFTAAAAFHFLPSLAEPDPTLGASLRMVPGVGAAPPSLVLVGGGDPTLRDGADCISNCLQGLADAVVQRGITHIADVSGDDSLFSHEPFGMGWSWNNLPFYFGAPISALTVNGNAAALRIAPGLVAGAPVTMSWAEGDDLLPVKNDAVTSLPGSENLLSVLRWPGANDVHLTGSLPAGAPARTYYLSVPNAAEAAAERLVRLLRSRGVKVDGEARARPPGDTVAGEEIARLAAPPLLESVINTATDSDNLSAELLLRHIARTTGGAGSEDGLAAVHAMLDGAGIDRAGIELFDGSGLSPYNRITPEATVRFLIWTTTQPWGDAFRAALPVGGQTGSLARRFRGTPLEARIFAKTGTVQGVNALSGFLIAASGETLVFSVIANDRPMDAESVLPVIDAMLLEIAAVN